MISELCSENTFLWSCIWQSTACITAGLIVSFALKRWPARAHRVLFLSIIAAVLVPLLSALVRHYELGVFVAEPPAVQPEVKARATPNEYATTMAVPVEDFKPGLGTTGEYSAPTVAIPSESIEIPWGRVAIWAWISASLILAGRLVVTFVMGVRLLSRAKPLDDDKIRAAARTAKAKLGVDEVVGAYSSDKVCGPVIWCWGRRPVLLLPSSNRETNGGLDWVSVLCHELAHWKRRDHIHGLLAELVLCVLPWNPLLWWAKRRLVGLSEQACDDWVLASGQQGTDYAESLLDLLPQRQMAFAPAVVSSKKGLAARVRRILQDKCGNPRTGVRWALLVSILVVVVVTAIAFAQSRPGRTKMVARKATDVPIIRLDGLPAGWRLEYDDGIVSGVGKRWRDGMAENLVELRAVPTPANEYDESWKEERLEIEILSIPGEKVGTIIIWGERGGDRIILAPDKYLLSYKREREDPNSGCHIPLNRVKFPVHLSRPGMYELKFRPKLETSRTAGPGEYAPTTCTGKIIDTEGNLVVGAKVATYEMFFDMAGNVNLRPVGTIITKSDGNFLFETTPSVKKSRSMGGYVVAIKEGLALGWAEWPLYGTQQVTITLGTSMKLGGMVVDESGAPVPKAEIRAVLFKKKTSEEEKIKWLPGIAPLEWLAAMSDNNGRFQFNDIPTNVRADLLITASGLSTIYTRKPDKIKSGYEGAAFAAGETDIKITMPPEARIEGKVVDKETGMGIAGATFAVVPHFTGVFLERFLCTSKEDGTFSIGGLRSGEYLIRADPLQGQGPRLNVTVESGKTTRDVIIKWPHVGQSRPALAIGAAFAQTRPGRTAESPLVKCSGKVIDERGRLLAGAKVAAYKMVDDGVAGNIKLLNVGRVATKEDGAFVFDTEPRPKFGGHTMNGYIVAVNKGMALGWAEWDMYGDKQVTIEVGEPAKLEGTIVDEAGQPIDGAEVRANLFRKNPKTITDWLPGITPLDLLAVKSDNDGHFQFNNIPADSYVDLLITAPGRATTYTYQWGPPPRFKGGAGPRFKAGQTDIKLVLPAEARIEGKVVDRNTGQGVAGAELAVVATFSPAFFYRFVCVSSEDGAFNVGGLHTGQYLIRTGPLDRGFPRMNLMAESGKTTRDVIIEWPHAVHSRPAGAKVKKTNDAGIGETRVVHFPRDRSLGRLMIRDATVKRHIDTFYYWVDNADSYGFGAEYLGEAKGDVTVPAGKLLWLIISNQAEWKDLSPLSKLNPDDLYRLSLAGPYQGGPKPTDRCMRHIASLTGLKVLEINYTSISSKGLKFIKGLRSLQRLTITDPITNSGLAHIATLPSLKGFYVQASPNVRQNKLTDAGLRHLAKLTSLEELCLGGERIGDGALVHLAKLASLQYLMLGGENFTDAGMAHLRNVPSLRILHLGSLTQLTDAALAHLSELESLENLNLHWAEGITDEGVAHLKKMRSLRKLDIGSSQVTDTGLAYLAEIKSLEYLTLPHDGITDKGLGYLTGLNKLKHLDVARAHYVDPNMDKNYYTDIGLRELSKLRSLEELTVGSIGITDEGMSELAKLTNLKTLWLFGCPISDRGLARLSTLKSIESLDLSCSETSIAAFAYLVSAMPNLTNLNVREMQRGNSVLDISNLTNLKRLAITLKEPSAFSDEDFVCIAKLKRLKSLQLWPTKLSNAGMAQLAGLTNIEMINIGGPDLTDDGLRHLANIKKLNHLTITDGKITDKGLRHLEGLKALSYLNIKSQKDLSPAALERLRRKLPGLAMLSIGEEHGGYGAYGGRQKALNKRSRRSQRDTRNRSRLRRR